MDNVERTCLRDLQIININIDEEGSTILQSVVERIYGECLSVE